MQKRRKCKKSYKKVLTGGKPGSAHKHKSTQENQQSVSQYEGEVVLGVTVQRHTATKTRYADVV